MLFKIGLLEDDKKDKLIKRIMTIFPRYVSIFSLQGEGRKMAIASLIAAKKLCELRNWEATNLEIQKTLYLAHMVSLGRSKGTNPLVTENFQAWDYGPVLPNVYNKAKIFGSSAVQNIFQIYVSISGTPESDIIEETVDMLVGKTAADLVAITHWEQGAWAEHYVPGAKGVIIPNSRILEEYNKRV